LCRTVSKRSRSDTQRNNIEKVAHTINNVNKHPLTFVFFFVIVENVALTFHRRIDCQRWLAEGNEMKYVILAIIFFVAALATFFAQFIAQDVLETQVSYLVGASIVCAIVATVRS